MRFSYFLKNKLDVKRISILVIVVFFMTALIIFPDRYIKSCYSGLILFATAVMPSLLPFFFLTQLLTITGVLNDLSSKASKLTLPLFRCGGLSLYAYLMSIISGYPVGSRIVYDLYSNGLISKGESTRISLLASTSGPLFVIGAVGIGMFNNKLYGFVMYISHILSSVITAIIFRFLGDEPKTFSPLNKQNISPNFLYDSIYNAVLSVLLVGGFVSIFYVFSEVLQDFKILYPLKKMFEFLLIPFNADSQTASALSLGVIETTMGSKALSTLNNKALSASLSTFLISFGGLSIIMQSLIYLQRAGVKPLVFLIGKICQAIISFFICFIILKVL
jgi:sporulation integral membrane protein YlbJ